MKMLTDCWRTDTRCDMGRLGVAIKLILLNSLSRNRIRHIINRSGVDTSLALHVAKQTCLKGCGVTSVICANELNLALYLTRLIGGALGLGC